MFQKINFDIQSIKDRYQQMIEKAKKEKEQNLQNETQKNNAKTSKKKG